MQNKAWFITHDDYIDRRIFFFVDVLEKKGYQVKLFPAPYINVLSCLDPPYVQRPVTERVVREYNVGLNKITEIEKQVLEKIQFESSYITKNKKRSKALVKFLSGLGMESKVKITVQDEKYCVTITNEKYTLCYNSITESLCRMMPSDRMSALKKGEEALMDFLIDSQETANVNSNDISIMQQIDDDGNRYVYVSIFTAGVMYVYDESAETLTEITPYLFDSKADVIDGRIFDYRNYKNKIYNYTPIITKVKEILLDEIPDIVYVADLPTLPIGIMLKEVTKCKLIVDCHEWWFKQTELWESQNKEKIELVNQFEAALYPQCDLRITVGENLARRMQEFYKCPFEVIYSCMSQKLSLHTTKDPYFIHRKYNLPDDSKIAIFQGGMSTFRNLENLARATKYLEKDSYLLLLTTGDYQDEFKRILDKEGSPDRVIWGGWIKQDDLLNYTQNVDVGIIPYTAINDYSECFVPNKLMEYFEVQVPIFYDKSMYELDLVAGNNHVGFGANLKDAQEFGTELNNLLHNDEQIAIYRNNYINCCNKFNYECQKNRLENICAKYKIY